MSVAGWEIPVGAAIAFAAGAIGTGWAQSRIGAAGAGAIAERPETAGSIIILEAIPETMVILGFVIAAMIILLVK
jgi:V/A-type H+/Na+-transporting ATPase subunit K